MACREIAHYGIQSMRYASMAVGAVLAYKGYVNENDFHLMTGCLSFSSASLLLTSENTKKLLGVRDDNSLDKLVK